MVEADEALRRKLESIVAILVNRLSTEKKPARVEALARCLQGFVTELREMEAIPVQSVYREVVERQDKLAERVKALEDWSNLAKAKLSMSTVRTQLSPGAM
jgi:hypothetical protein